jgi:membrane protein required for colicin V production
MTVFDYLVIGIMVLSLLVGWWRGLVYEVLSLLGWMAAYFVARLFAHSLAPHLPAVLGSEVLQTAAAFVVLFLGTLILSGIVSLLLSKLVKFVGLGWLDGLLGALFGLIRGTFLILLAVLLAGVTSLPQEKFWQDAQ